MMNQSDIFEDLEIGGIKLKELPVAYKNQSDTIRLYVLEEESGFIAAAVEFASCSPNGEIWKDPSLEVDVLFVATAYFDGVRHLEWNRKGGELDGYIYYPSMADIIEALKKVHEIEEKIKNES